MGDHGWIRSRLLGLAAGAIGTVAAVQSGVAPAAAQQLPVQTIFAFDSSTGANPEDSLVADAKGVLYGTTASLGGGDGGTVFSLTPPAAGQTAWTLQVLHAFTGNPNTNSTDGEDPLAPVTLHNGTIYGTTFVGGDGMNGCYADGLGCGTVFKLVPPSGTVTTWTYSVLHRFSAVESDDDGAMPTGGVYIDANGNVFGTTSQGGNNSLCSGGPGVGCGAFYEISASGVYTILHRFGGGSDVNNPGYSLTLGSSGVFYGASQFGGDDGKTCAFASLGFGCGVVFKLTPPAKGTTTWTESVLYRFTGGTDGSNPGASLTLDAKGNLYGSTSFGGAGKDGVVFRLAPPTASQPKWTESVLYAFAGGSDGAAPASPLLLTSGGSILGTTSGGANSDCAGGEGCGMIFELSPPAAGTVPWVEAVLHSFTGGVDGGESSSGLLPLANNMYYGTTLVGGTTADSGGHGSGNVFRIHLAAHCGQPWGHPCFK